MKQVSVGLKLTIRRFPTTGTGDRIWVPARFGLDGLWEYQTAYSGCRPIDPIGNEVIHNAHACGYGYFVYVYDTS